MPVIGIDAGATKTDCFLADETGAIVYQSRGPGANLQIMGAAAVEAVLGELIDEVLSGRSAGVDALCVGIAGVDRPQDSSQEILHEASREIVHAADAVIEKLEIAGENFHLVLSGGLWKAVPGLKNEISRLVSKIAPRAQVEQLQVEPAVGAVTLALQSLS